MQTAAIPTPEPRIARFEKLAFGLFLHWGLYSQIGKGEWAKNNYGISTDEYMKLMKTFTAKDFKAYLKYLRDSIEILCTYYGPIGGFWFDGNWSKPDENWEEDALYAVIRKHQPGAMIINNTGIGAEGKLGNPEIDSTTFERGRPTPPDRRGWKKYVAGEMCHTMNFHWGIANNDFNYLSPAHVIENLCICRGAGANLLMNVGPTATGALPDYEAAALARVGDWIRLHGGDTGPIYEGKSIGVQGDEYDYGLQVGDDLYLFVFELTAVADTRAHGNETRGPGARAFSGVPENYVNAVWMDSGEKLKTERKDGKFVLHATGYPYGVNTVVRVAKVTG
jgi:alpha-L-fucosidase